MTLFDEITNGKLTLYELGDPDTEEYRERKQELRLKLEALRCLLNDEQKTALEAKGLFKSSFEKWVEKASHEELSNAYEAERQKWVREGY